MVKTLWVSLLFVLHAPLATAQDNESRFAVDVMYPETTESSRTISLAGSVEAKQNAQLAPLEPGLVDELLVEIGDTVGLGQPLLRLDDTLATLEQEVAQTEVITASVTLKEAIRLHEEVIALSKKQVVPQTLLAERAANVANAQAQLSRANARLAVNKELVNRHVLTAPFAGVVAARNIDLGEWVNQQTPLLTLVAQQDLRVSIAIPQQYFSYLSNQSVSVQIIPDTQNAEAIRGTLNRFVPVSDSFSRTFVGQIDLPQDTTLVAGMSATVNISLPDSLQSQIILPRSAIKRHPDGGSSVFYVSDNRAKRVIVSFTDLADNRVAINNQPSNRLYVITGVELLKDNMQVDANNVSSNR